jgi:hypothetical protein
MIVELIEKCQNAKKVLQEMAGIAEKDFMLDDIIVDEEYPPSIEVYYKITNRDGKEIYLKKNVMGAVYDAVIEELLKCKSVDKKTKEILKKEKEELDKKCDEYMRDP